MVVLRRGGVKSCLAGEKILGAKKMGSEKMNEIRRWERESQRVNKRNNK